MQLILIALLLGPFWAFAQPPTLAERLGYPADAKLLIIHADDLGVAHAENAASIRALEAGVVNSASIMVPCPWFPEIAAYAARHPEGDFGLHLTLTSEWKYLKWRPLTPHDRVPGLVDEHAFFHPAFSGLLQDATPAEVEQELRAQIELALAYGIDVTHLDSHMFSIFTRPEYVAVYQKLGREYDLPVLLLDPPWLTGRNLDAAELYGPDDLVVDRLYMALPADDQTGLANYYREVLTNLEPGFNVLLLHCAYDNAEMQAVTVDYDGFGARWRQEDFDFFTSNACRELLAEAGIQLVTWREIRDKVIRQD